jgi:hypothetical protein
MPTPDSARIRRLLPDDAAALSACFERCYGRTYATPLFYDVPGLRGAIAAGELRGVVASVGERIVGHTGLTVRHPGARAIEAGNTIVDPEFRGGGILGQLGGALGDLCRQLGYVGYVHYPTTAHTIMQTRSVAGGGVETGVMLAYIPAETEYRAIDRNAGRLAATVVYQPFTRAPAREVYLPARYDFVRALYEKIPLARTLLPGGAPLAGRCQLITRWNERRALLHVDCVRAGTDLAAAVAQARGEYSAQVVLVDLGLDAPDVDAAVAALRVLGFLYCAVLPEFGAADVLRMQWIADRAAGLQAELANEGARTLLARIAADGNSDQATPSFPG